VRAYKFALPRASFSTFSLSLFGANFPRRQERGEGGEGGEGGVERAPARARTSRKRDELAAKFFRRQRLPARARPPPPGPGPARRR